MPKAFLYLLIALFIDALQAGIEIAFDAIGAFSGTIIGTVSGAAAGYKLCGLLPTISTTAQLTCSTAGGTIGGIIGTFANGPLATAAEPIAAMLGFILGIVISICIGVPLVLLMATDGMCYPQYLLPCGTAEMLPFFDVLPGWTAYVVLSFLKKKSQIGTNLLATTTKVAIGAAKGLRLGPEGAIIGAAVEIEKRNKSAREAGRTRNMDGVTVTRQAPLRRDFTKKAS